MGRDREELRDDVRVEFNAFNEGAGLIHCLKMYKRLFGVEVKKVGVDAGYAGTDNGDYCKENGIQTSFGTQKEHYDQGESRPGRS